jgi:hypothetical protein
MNERRAETKLQQKAKIRSFERPESHSRDLDPLT